VKDVEHQDALLVWPEIWFGCDSNCQTLVVVCCDCRRIKRNETSASEQLIRIARVTVSRVTLADTAADRGVLVQLTGDTDNGRRCTLIRASSELGVHRGGDVVTGGGEGTDAEEDHPTPLQVTWLLLGMGVSGNLLIG